MTTARQHVENQAAKLSFRLPLTDPMTNPPNRPIPPHTPVRPTWHDEQRMQAEYDSHDNTCGGCNRCSGVAS